MPNRAPIISLAKRRNVRANEDFHLKNLLRVRDPDNDPILRYRIYSGSQAEGNRQGYFMLDGKQMPVGKGFTVTADEMQRLVFVAGKLGQRRNQYDFFRIRAYDGNSWSATQRMTVRTLYNRFRPLVASRHKAIVAETSISARSLFAWRDRDRNSAKFFEFRDKSTFDDGAYMILDGVKVDHTNWVRLTPSDVSRLRIVGGIQTATDRIAVRVYDGRFWSGGRTTIVKTLARPKIDVIRESVVNELERVRMTSLVSDNGAVPPITAYQFIDLSGDPTSGQIVRGFNPYAANEVHQVSAQLFRTLDFRGGNYDSPSRDSILVRAFNGTAWSTWERMEMNTEPHYIDSLLVGEDWTKYLPTPQPGEPLTITYSFLQQVPDYYEADADERTGFARLSVSVTQSIRGILQHLSEVINVRFVEVSDVAGGVMRFGSHDYGDQPPGHAYNPMDTAVDQRGGDVWLNNKVDLDNDPPILWGLRYPALTGLGDDEVAFTRRLIGEAMGLRIPDTGFPLLPPSSDNHQYTLMSHLPLPIELGGERPKAADNGNAITYQLYDAAALRSIYGANPNLRLGNNTYMFDTTATVQTVYDMDGNDTIDASNQTSAASIDLRSGYFSSIGRNASNNITISYGTMIENATGGRNNDRIIGNYADNVIRGGDGNDFMNGLGGNDRLIGELGADRYRVGIANGAEVVDDQSDSDNDVLELNFNTLTSPSFMDNLAFRRAGDDLLIDLTLDKLSGRDLVDASVRVVNMTGTNGVEILRIFGGGNQVGDDIDLTSVFAASDNQYRHLQLTGGTSGYGQLAAQA